MSSLQFYHSYEGRVINAFIHNVERVYGTLSHAVSNDLVRLLQLFIKPYFNYKDHDEKERKRQLHILYGRIEIEYPDVFQLFKQCCEEYEDEELFDILCDKDYLDDQEWENSPILGTMLGEDINDQFQNVGEDFAQFVYDVLTTKHLRVVRPSSVLLHSLCANM